ncbi:hypothetical protein Tco_0888777 [Tanacetum coccineum]
MLNSRDAISSDYFAYYELLAEQAKNSKYHRLLKQRDSPGRNRLGSRGTNLEVVVVQGGVLLAVVAAVLDEPGASLSLETDIYYYHLDSMETVVVERGSRAESEAQLC